MYYVSRKINPHSIWGKSHLCSFGKQCKRGGMHSGLCRGSPATTAAHSGCTPGWWGPRGCTCAQSGCPCKGWLVLPHPCQIHLCWCSSLHSQLWVQGLVVGRNEQRFPLKPISSKYFLISFKICYNNTLHQIHVWSEAPWQPSMFPSPNHLCWRSQIWDLLVGELGWVEEFSSFVAFVSSFWLLSVYGSQGYK